MDKSSLSKLTVVQLKSKLRENKLKVSGRKAELVDRLFQHYQSNPSNSNSNLNVSISPVKKKLPKTKVVKQTNVSSNNNFPAFLPIEEETFVEKTVSYSILNTISIENQSQSLNFISPIIGTSDDLQSLQKLFNFGFITEAEFKQRISNIKNTDNFYSSELSSQLNELSISNEKKTLQISVSIYKQWCDAIIGDNTSILNNILVNIISVIDSLDENDLSNFEIYDRVCKMLKKLRLRHFQNNLSKSLMQQVYTKLSILFKTFKNGDFLILTLSVFSKLSWAERTAKNTLLNLNIDRLLDLGEGQINDSIYSSELTVHLVECLRFFIRSFNYESLTTLQKERIKKLTVYFVNTSNHIPILQHALVTLSIPCYFTSEMDILLKEHKYFLETIYKHLSNASPIVISSAVATFINITSGTDEVLNSVIQLGVFDKLISIVNTYYYDERNDSKELLKETYFCISNFAGGNKNQVELCLDRDILKIIISQYPEATKETQREMIWCLSNFFLSGANPSYFNNIKLFKLSNEILQDVNIEDEDSEQFRKGLLRAKKDILPILNIDHPVIDTLIENLS